ncbi:hypothetical protein D3C80_1805710 [compost metagenome]
MSSAAVKQAGRIGCITVEKLQKIVTMEPADAAIAVRQKIGLRQQKGGSTKTNYGLAAPVRTLDDIDQCLLPWPILCKQPADNGNIITIV